MPLPPEFPEIDFDVFHNLDLPKQMQSGRGALAARAAQGLHSLALRLPSGAAYTYRPGPDGVVVVAGEDSAEAVIEMDLESWRGLVHELEAPAGLLYARRARGVRGNPLALMNWESALRALYNGRPPYLPAQQVLPDRNGYALDPQATFSLAADREEMIHFLRVAGYLFVRDVFSASEVEGFLDEAEQLKAEARPGDKLSWWGRTETGAEVLCRVTRGIAKPRLASLREDSRILSLKNLADAGFTHKVGEGQGVTVIFKHPGMSEGGLGDLPWHRDCGMGGHAVMCPTLVLSVYLTEATPESGELAMLPGSHRASFNAHDRRIDPKRYAAHFRAQPGSVSLHYSDTVHAAPPPTDPTLARHRISAILSFARPQAEHHRGEGSYNDVLHQREDGQIEHLEALAKRL